MRRLACIAAILGATTAHAETNCELWPEFDAYVSLNARTRAYLLATTTRIDQEATRGAPLDPVTEGTVGVHLDVSVTPALRRALLEEDWGRNRYLWVRIGYQHARSFGDPEPVSEFRDNRAVLELNGRTPPLIGSLEWVTRIRLDACDRNGESSSLYRLRVGVERQYTVRGRPAIPYATAETLYDTRYDAWKRQRHQLGVELGWMRSGASIRTWRRAMTGAPNRPGSMR